MTALQELIEIMNHMIENGDNDLQLNSKESPRVSIVG